MSMSKLSFGSVCSGIEAASMAWNPLGWQASWLSEIEPFPSEVLKHHYPDTPNYGDMTKLPDMVLSGEIEAPDVLVGGTPCQSFSVAGAREGLSDERGQLTIKYVELANAIDTVRRRDGKNECIIVWENVPGILNSKDNAFGCFIAALAGGSSEARAPGGGRWANAGYVLGPKRAVAWRVLDAQYFGLAQRRKRVFVVASARKDFCSAEVLFEFGGVRRDIAPSREAGQEVTGNVGAGANQTGFRKLTFESYAQDETASTMMARDYKSYTDLVAFNSRQDPVSGDVFGTLDASSSQAQAIAYGCTPTKLNDVVNTITASYGRGGVDLETKPLALVTAIADDVTPKASDDVAFTLNATDHKCPQAIAVQGSVIGRKSENGPQGSGHDDTGVCFTQTSVDRHAVATSSSVRRLTPIECERLQGFPDGFTAIPWRGKPTDECPDGHRYKALGNSMAVPCMTWLGQRIQVVLCIDVTRWIGERINAAL